MVDLLLDNVSLIIGGAVGLAIGLWVIPSIAGFFGMSQVEFVSPVPEYPVSSIASW